MNRVERVELTNANKQYGPPGEPVRLHVTFSLTPIVEETWNRLFGRKLKDYNERSKNAFEPEGEDSSDSRENDDDSAWKFRRDKESGVVTNASYVWACCHSIEEIQSLHETLKEIVRRTNDEYPKFVQELKTIDAKELADKNEIERLKKALNPNI